MTKVAYFSPFNPKKSGISDFSEELLPELKKYVDVDIFFDGPISNAEIASGFVRHSLSDIDDTALRESYDALVYEVGNNVTFHRSIIETFEKYPGILELHDFSLHNYLAARTYVHNDIPAYLDAIRYSHGEYGVGLVTPFLEGKARAPWETHAMELTVNKHLIDRAKAVIVHSDMAKQMTRAINPAVPVINIALHSSEILEDHEKFRIQCKEKLKIPKKRFVLGSFGYATRSKRIPQILGALEKYKSDVSNDFLYLVVGKTEDFDLDKEIRERGLEGNVLSTGFTSLDDFKIFMGACDVCFNLRYPTHGESSATLHRMLGMGKFVIVTAIGTFDEYPSDFIRQVRYDGNETNDIFLALKDLHCGSLDLRKIGEHAIQYAREHCSLEWNARTYADFIQGIQRGNKEEDYLDLSIDRLFELYLLDERYIEHVSKALGFLLEGET